MIDAQTAPYGAFVLRVTVGIALLAHAYLKIAVFTIPGTVGFFESLGYPGFLAYLTILAELVGGIALILGVGVRVVALATLPILLGAIHAHWGAGWFFVNEGGGWEYPAFWAAAHVAIAALGAGAFAVKLPVLEKALGRFA
ncbi:MAG: DoxX family protein [Pseudomonadota bacterium]